MIVLTYLGAAAFSLPQWLAWTTADLGSWSQCTTIWHQQRAQDFLDGHEYTYFFYWEQIYTVVHLTTMFWGPFLVLFLSYACITLTLFLYSFSSPQGTTELQRVNTDDRSIATNQDSCACRDKLSTNDSPVEPVRSWRIEMRARMCHISAVVILAYLLCWLPYNLISLAMFISKDLSVSLSIHFDIVRVFVIFNTFLNPFIYGFRDS
ncbi:unnamed protein product [Toxocara canis]|nr:unnamed protein product [Toxocara canis]